VADPETHELLHYTEKPETFVSICLVCFSLHVFILPAKKKYPMLELDWYQLHFFCF
jgi:hypothetical protein